MNPQEKEELRYIVAAYGHIIENGEELTAQQFAMLLGIYYDLGNPRNQYAYYFLKRIQATFTKDRLNGIRYQIIDKESES